MARPTRNFTDKEKKRVSKLAGYGLTQAQICTILECSEKTLLKHCGKEWEKGKLLAIETVADTLFQNIKKGDTASVFFYLKTQAHWCEKQVVEHQNLTDYRNVIGTITEED